MMWNTLLQTQCKASVCVDTKCIRWLIVSKSCCYTREAFAITCIINAYNTSVCTSYLSVFCLFMPFCVFTKHRKAQGCGMGWQTNQRNPWDCHKALGGGKEQESQSGTHTALQGKDPSTQGMTGAVWMGLRAHFPSLVLLDWTGLSQLAGQLQWLPPGRSRVSVEPGTGRVCDTAKI